MNSKTKLSSILGGEKRWNLYNYKVCSHHTPVFKFEAQVLDVWLTIETGEVDMHWVVTVDHVKRGAVSCHDGILVDNLAVVCLQGHKHCHCTKHFINF